MPQVDAYASYPHYYDHLKPIWDALDTQGVFYTGPLVGKGTATRALGEGPPTLIAGYPDLKRTRHRPHIFVEHGAGETWGMVDPHYAGGPGRDSVILFLCPNQKVAEANSRYQAPSIVVGSPRVESLKLVPRPAANTNVVVSFHWDNRRFDNTVSALPHFLPHLGSWAADSRFEIKGHAHPRIADRAEKYFARAGIPFLRRFEDVVSWADYYACDNSSTLFEAAACGLKMIYLDAPWFSHDAESWRFGKYSDIAPHCAGDELGDIITNYNRVSYDEMVTEIFGTLNGSAQRAADAIKEVLNDSRTQSLLPGPTPGADPSQPSLLGID